MYAVIESGGKQHRVQEGETLKLEKLKIGTGESFDFDKVLLVGAGPDVKIGTPFVEGGKVSAEVVSHGRHKKVTIVKFSRRKHYRKQMGHQRIKLHRPGLVGGLCRLRAAPDGVGTES